jgi:hypothetical protein
MVQIEFPAGNKRVRLAAGIAHGSLRRRQCYAVLNHAGRRAIVDRIV